MSHLSNKEDTWRDVLWIKWGLAKGPPGFLAYEETGETSDTSSWKM